MMNRFEGPGAREARIRYLDGDFQVTSPGAFVRCAVTGESIPLDELQILERRAPGGLCQRHGLAEARDGGQSDAQGALGHNDAPTNVFPGSCSCSSMISGLGADLAAALLGDRHDRRAHRHVVA